MKRIKKVWRKKEQVQANENNVSREEKGKETCYPILIENDAKRQEENIQNLGVSVSKNEVDKCTESGCHLASQV